MTPSSRTDLLILLALAIFAALAFPAAVDEWRDAVAFRAVVNGARR